MEDAKPQKEHEFLQRVVGDWVMVSTSTQDDYSTDDPFTEKVTSIGGLWIIAHGVGKMPDGTPMSAVLTIGYDTEAGHFTGTWVGSMMTKLWVYKGWLEADGKTLTLEAQGPSFDGSGKIETYHDVLTLHDDNHRTFSGSTRQADGSYKQFMSSDFRRVGTGGKQ